MVHRPVRQGRRLLYNTYVAATLKINEIYGTLAGEGSRAGRACVIVRLTGCNLRCGWCDTTYAQEEGTDRTIEEVLAAVERAGDGMVLVTGGEPLAQPGTGELLRRLCDAGREVVLETNGSMDISAVDARVARCVDVKCPGSGEGGSFLPGNLDHLRGGDEVKFILAGRGDYDFAREFIGTYDSLGACAVVLTPAAGRLAAAELAGWMLTDAGLGGNVRLGLQLHKIIWPEARRGV